MQISVTIRTVDNETHHSVVEADNPDVAVDAMVDGVDWISLPVKHTALRICVAHIVSVSATPTDDEGRANYNPPAIVRGFHYARKSS